MFFSRPGRRSAASKTLYDIVSFRNTVRHSAGGALSERDAERHLAEQLPKLQAVLSDLRFVTDYPLVWLERMDYAGGKFVFRCQLCMGSHADFSSLTFPARTPCETGRLFVRRAETDELLALDPLMCLDACSVCGSREVFFLHALTETTVEYAEFVRGHHHATAVPSETLARLRGEARDRLHRAEQSPP